VVTQEEELKYTVQNPLKDYIDHAIAEAQKRVELLLLLMRSTHSTEIMLKIRSRYCLIISQPDNGEQALEIAENLIRSGQLTLLLLTLLPL
jgi:recombination protein RecA